MRVEIHVLLPFFLGDFSAQILHDSARLVVSRYAHHRSKLAALHAFSVKWRANSDDYFEILIRAAARGHARGQSTLRGGTLSAHNGLRRHLHRVLHLSIGYLVHGLISSIHGSAQLLLTFHSVLKILLLGHHLLLPIYDKKRGFAISHA